MMRGTAWTSATASSGSVDGCAWAAYDRTEAVTIFGLPSSGPGRLDVWLPPIGYPRDMPRVLVAEDETAIADAVVYARRSEGLEVEHCLLGRDVLGRGPPTVLGGT